MQLVTATFKQKSGSVIVLTRNPNDRQRSRPLPPMPLFDITIDGASRNPMTEKDTIEFLTQASFEDDPCDHLMPDQKVYAEDTVRNLFTILVESM